MSRTDTHPATASQARAVASASGVIDTLEHLSELVESAKTTLLSGTIKVDREAILELIEELRDQMPKAVEHADLLLKEAQNVHADAGRQAEEIIATARARALELVEHEAVVQQARTRADEIVDNAQNQAEKLRTDADEYCDARLASFAEDLSALQTQVQAGRDKLAERLGPNASRPRWDKPAEPEWPQ